jgi:CheY-like chemotaxis protein
VEMPVMDGIEATRRIRAMGYSPERLPIVAMTGHTDATVQQRGRDVGMNDYLTKPVDPEALHASLERWLPGSETEQNGTAQKAGEVHPSLSKNILASLDFYPAEEGLDINIEAGLAALGGNRPLYRSLLIRFTSHYGDSPAQLLELLEAKDYQAASRHVHTVKGVAANLGLERIARVARAMENCLPQNPPSERLLHAFQKYMEVLLTRVAELDRKKPTSKEINLVPLPANMLKQLLAQLEELPGRFETDWGSVESAVADLFDLTRNTAYAEDMKTLLESTKEFDARLFASQAEQLRQKLLRDGAGD